MPSKSIRRELILIVVLSQALLAAGLVFAGVYYTHRRLRTTLQAGIQARLMSVAALVRYPEDAKAPLIFEGSLVPRPLDMSHPDLYEIRIPGAVVARSANWPDGLHLECSNDKPWSMFKVSGVEYRALCRNQVPILDREEGQADRPSTLTVVYAASTVETDNQVQSAGLSIAGVSLILLGGTVWLALWGIRRGLLPLQQLAQQASRVSAQNWAFQSPQEVDQIAELRPLNEAMATMLDRLQKSFIQQREFLGNAAHELKTPVAILKSTLQSLLQKPRSTAEYEQRLGEALEDMERLEKLLQWMLRLARAEQWAHGTLRRDLGPIEIAPTCEEAIDALRGLAQERHAQIEFKTDRGLRCKADPEDLELVWINLLENALRYSPHGTIVKFSVRGNGSGRAQVLVEDQGMGIPQEELTQVFERFHRGDPSRTRETGGFGLGLAIAKALVEAYGGTIRASSAVGRGTHMTVELPTVAAGG
jgi:signal transduction histidine kinase